MLYAGAQDGGVFRSTDGGVSWQEADYGLPSGTAILKLAVASGDANVVYAGSSGDGVYVSTNGGGSWQDDNGGDYSLESASVAGLASEPSQSSSVLALTSDGRVYYISSSGTAYLEATLSTWGKATALAASPRSSNILFAGTADTGIYRSTDEGYSWQQVAGSSMGAIGAFAFNPRNPSVAFAATAAGMYQTIDGGDSWQPEMRGIPGGTAFTAVAVDPEDGAIVIGGTSDGQIYRSVDGGTSWHLSTLECGCAGPVNALFYNPPGGVVLAGLSGGVCLARSDNDGVTWFASDSPNSGEPILSLAGVARAAMPTDPVPAPQGNPVGVRYFAATRHTVSGAFLNFYNANNGLKIFGLPLTEPFVEGGHLVQYFERSRLVYERGNVTLAPLGLQVTAGRRFPAARCFCVAGQVWFASTYHTLSGVFMAFWYSHNGRVLFGAPISQPLYEQNGDGTGRTYLVQYFQNARMEYHPELAGTPNVVTLGQLGRQILHQRGWI